MKSLSYLEITGTAHEIGIQLGQFGNAAVHGYLLNSPAWQELMQWKGHDQVNHMQQLVKERFPAIWQELHGLAQGLSLPFDEVFIWNARGDLWAQAPDGCSTILQADPLPRISHNEDGDPGFHGACAVARVRPEQGAAYVSFLYPGSIAGHTFALNEHKLCMTVNNIRALFAQPGVPRMVLCRAALECTDHTEVVELLQAHPRCGAFNLNVGDCHQHVHSIEFNDGQVSLMRVNTPYFHANHAIHKSVRDYPQYITGTSGYRQLQGQAWVQHPNFEGDPLAILGNRAHERFPIYRRQENDTDNENTIATADFQYHGGQVDWQVYEDPLQPPVFEFIDLELQ